MVFVGSSEVETAGGGRERFAARAPASKDRGARRVDHAAVWRGDIADAGENAVVYIRERDCPTLVTTNVQAG
jgi:hypothetical protein